MLPLDLEAFGRAAGWDKLPGEVLDLHFEHTTRDADFPGALLPAMSPKGVYWYGATATPAEWRLLQPLLLAYAGPTVTLFTGQSMPPDAGILAERLLQNSGVCAIARLVPGPKCEELTRRALDRLCQALKLRPATKRTQREPTSRLLARLEMCLAAGDRTGAQDLLDQLRDELRLDTLNLHSIQVRILSHFRAWHELVDAHWFAELCQARKPALVAKSMLEALWHARLAESADDEIQLRRRYHADDVRPFARPLLAQVSDCASDFIRRIRSLDQLGGPPALTTEAAAQDLLDLAANAPSNLHVAQARAAIEALPEPARATVLHSGAGKQALNEIGSLDLPAPTNWHEWLAALADPRFENAVSVAREGVGQWPASQIATAKEAKSFADELLTLGLAGGSGSGRLIESLPYLVQWTKADPDYPRPLLAPIYDTLLQLFDLVERRGSAEREAAADLFEAILSLGLSKEHYGRLLSDFSKLIDEGAGRTTVYWLIDIAAALLEHPAPDTAARLGFLNRLLVSLQGVLASLSPGQRAAYRRIAAGASWPVLPEPLDATASSKLTALDGQSIAIYTLTESAGRQAEMALRELAPTLRIELAHDRVASARLIRLAREASIFALATASAKHAATDCIVANRGTRPLLYAAGRGFSSIVRVVEEFAASGRA